METATPTHDTPPNRQPDVLETFQAPPGAGTLGVWLFTAGLTVAFAWVLFGYVLVRRGAETPGPTVPAWFWFSTFTILVSSVALHWSYLSAKLGRVSVAAMALKLSTALGLLFLVLQTPGLVELVAGHRRHEGPEAASYMLVLALVGLHGLHVLLGLGRMVVLNRRRHSDHADAHGAASLKQMCLFWHFLAVAWVAMFGVVLWA